ncbi:MAG: SDR family NAD(P)-dependent oxidoreductase [Pseudomonadota bacterium]
MTQKPLAIVAGAGSGLGSALMEHFNSNGMHAVGLTRSGNGQSGLDIRACDLSVENTAHDVLSGLITEFGPPHVVVHNAAHLVIAPLGKTSAEDYETCWRNMALSAFNLAQNTMQSMANSGGGTFIVSGATASLRGGGKFSAFASAKFALRGLAQALARELQPQGVHVVHAILDGIIDTDKSRELHSLDPSKMMKPEEIAEIYWQITQQPPSVWTHELDLRPQSEGF